MQGELDKAHIGVLPAMSGASRFLEADRGWAFDKVAAFANGAPDTFVCINVRPLARPAHLYTAYY